MFASMRHFFRNTVGPLLLILLCPPSVMILWYLNAELGGSFTAFVDLVSHTGFFSTMLQIWSPYALGSQEAWQLIVYFSLFELLLMRVIPGKRFEGPKTPQGNTPVYKANGVACFVITIGTFYLLTDIFHLFSASIIYDNLGGILGALNVMAPLFCLVLYCKGRFFPSSSDKSVTGNFVFDYYWGTELYPRLFGFDIKLFTNCRFGMMSWGLILLSYMSKQRELYGLSDALLISVLLQLLYITKFFLWETGYLRSMDIMHDRAGFYICWGCLVWVPSVYTSATMYMVHNPVHLGGVVAMCILLLGSLSILINYWADLQRAHFRKTEGTCLIWGRAPHITHASYTTGEGIERKSVLLGSGFWGLARHFHYVPEIAGAFFWTVPALFSSVLPYFYVIFLTILLLDRAVRDDKRCAQKYGEDWERHKQLVPYKIIPGIW